MKRQVEIEDSLGERVDSAIADVKVELLNYLEENDCSTLPCLSNDLDYSGAIHEIVDGSVPIYTKEINDTWYLYASELEEAYDNAGVGENPRENNGMAAIYYYIYEQVADWYHNNAEDLFDTWREKKDRLEELEGDKEELENVIEEEKGDVEPDNELLEKWAGELKDIEEEIERVEQEIKDL